MTVRVKKTFIDAYEQKYGAISLEDSECGRQDHGDYYVWEIAPDLLGCGTAIELSDTHVTFVNALSTIHNEANEITAVNGIIFGNQALVVNCQLKCINFDLSKKGVSFPTQLSLHFNPT